MHVVQIAPPWVPIPPQDYGGTELMVANLVPSGILRRFLAR
ncbi:MAG: hypothetical protein P8X58_14910 [Syntrophobacterales bacterium]